MLLTSLVLGTSALSCDDPSPCQVSTEPGCEAAVARTSRVLAIAPKAQQTPVWCWAATAQMVFEHYNLPNLNPGNNYQCGIVGAYGFMLQGAASPCFTNCLACVSTIGNLGEMQRVITQYGTVATAAGRPSRNLSAVARTSALRYEELVAEIDGGRPVIAGVSLGGLPLPGVSAHAVLLVGYDNRDGSQSVVVNDPYPYQSASLSSDPYLAANARRQAPGQYLVPYATMIARITWGNTIWKIQ